MSVKFCAITNRFAYTAVSPCSSPSGYINLVMSKKRREMAVFSGHGVKKMKMFSWQISSLTAEYTPKSSSTSGKTPWNLS